MTRHINRALPGWLLWTKSLTKFMTFNRWCGPDTHSLFLARSPPRTLKLSDIRYHVSNTYTSSYPSLPSNLPTFSIRPYISSRSLHKSTILLYVDFTKITTILLNTVLPLSRSRPFSHDAWHMPLMMEAKCRWRPLYFSNPRSHRHYVCDGSSLLRTFLAGQV